MRDWLRTLHDALQARSEPVVRVVVAAVRGSAPREPGACMLITPESELGTIGGGHLEFVATRIARDLLESPAAAARLDRFSLGASLGQCCGGIVELWFQRYDASDLGFLAQALAARETGEASVMASTVIAEGGARQRLLSHESAVREGAGALDGEQDAVLLHRVQVPMLYERILRRDTRLWLFGAGHVATALVRVLAPLPFAITWIDSREGMLADDPPLDVHTVYSPQPAEELRDMEAGAWALVMTHSHDEDFSLCEALLRHGRFGWAGVIGSLPKATRFRQRLLQRGFSAQEISRLAMPIGIDGIRSKEAAAIAVAVAAQLLQERERRATRENVTTTAARKS